VAREAQAVVTLAELVRLDAARQPDAAALPAPSRSALPPPAATGPDTLPTDSRKEALHVHPTRPV
jgi:hypothetical protein